MSAWNDRNEFIRTLWKLMLPIVVQNLISAVVSTADVLMLSSVSESALSASSLAGQVTFTLTLFYSGLSTGASKLPFVMARFRKYKWLKNLTRSSS